MSNDYLSREERLQHILAAYLQEVEAGKNPDRDQLLAQHPDLADDLRSFLAANDKMRRLVDQNEAATLAPELSAAAPAVGTTVRYFGDYELLEEIARGGMGVVYKARQVSLNRIVALKMILAGQLASATEVQRFHTEAKAAANLDHPNIVAIYEVGEHEGLHYFSMKLIVEGPKDSVDQRQAARLLATAAHAVHHAHQRGIIHRDLKPANILVDDQGQPHLTDFGLAKRIEGDVHLSQSGAIVGTPAYMAPEQAAGAKVLTTAADVYSLGAVLYQWLTGKPPFVGTTPLEILLQVMEREPTPPRQAHPAIDRDLETICLKCLTKEPQRRYGSAEMLAEDLERWLRGEPILARPISRPERVFKWVRRRPERAMLYGLALLVLVIGLGWTARQGWLSWEQTIAHRKKVEEDQRLATKKLEEDQRFAAEKVLAAKEAKRHDQRQRAQQDLHQGRGICRGQAGQGLDVGMLQLARGLGLAVAAEDKNLEDQLRLELGRYAPLLPRLVAMPWNAEGGGVDPKYAVSLSRDGKRLVAVGRRWGIRVCDVDGGQLLGPPFSDKDPSVVIVAISPDGSQFVNDFGLCDAATGKLLRKMDGLGQYTLFAPDGKRLLSNLGGKRLLLLDPATGQAVGKPLDGVATLYLPAQAPQAVLALRAFSPDSSLIAVTRNVLEAGQWRSDVRLWDAVKGEAREPILPAEGVRALAFSPDSTLLATAGWENEIQNRGGNASNNKWTVRLWDVKTGKQKGETLPLPWLTREILLAFSPDGKLLLTAGNGGSQLWDLDTGKPRWPEIGSVGSPLLVSFNPDGKTFWALTHSGLSQWDTASGRFLASFENQCQNNFIGGAASADGRRVAMLGGRLESHHRLVEKGEPAGSSEWQSGLTILVWELPAARPGANEAPRPLAGTPEQIYLWVQARTGRELADGHSITNMGFEDWHKCREKLRATGGLPVP